MSKKIKSSTFNALIAIIVILSISTIYFSIDKFKQSQLHKLISDSQCSKPDKLCVYVKYKYTDAIEATVRVVAGPYYYKDERRNDYDKYWNNWLKDKSNKNNKIYEDDSFIIKDFFSALDSSHLSIRLLDKDVFLIDILRIDFGNNSKLKENGVINSANTVNESGKIIRKHYQFKKKFVTDDFKRIKDISIQWSSGLIDGLPN